MKKIFIRFMAGAMCLCMLLLTACVDSDGTESVDTSSEQTENNDITDESNGTEDEDTSEVTTGEENTSDTSDTSDTSGGAANPDNDEDAEINITDDEIKAVGNVTVCGKSLSGFMVVTETSNSSAANLLRNAMKTAFNIKAVIHIQASQMKMSAYKNNNYVRIITLPDNAAVDTLKSNEVRYIEDSGNIKVIIGSPQISDTDAVAILIKEIFAKKDLTGLNEVKTLDVKGALATAVAEADKKKNDILNSESKYTAENIAGGACYYVSYSNGNDENDGLTPETAWKTVSKVNDTQIPAGSVVLFKRGDTWRLDTYAYAGNAGFLLLKSGVIYSAYGEGPKPVISGSPVDAAKGGTWTLTSTPNVWVYDRVYKGMPDPANDDVGIIVFNGGEAYGKKMIKGHSEMPFSGLSDLDEDYEFYYNPDDNRVYLYCDQNPADKYESIEMGVRLNLVRISGVNNVYFDNFELKYGAAHGIAVAVASNIRVTNCEIGWIGGGMLNKTARYGNGVELNRDCKNIKIDGNYFYQIYDAAMTHQFDTRSDPSSKRTSYHERIDYINNVVEYCFWGIEYYVHQAPVNMPERYMDKINIENNHILYTGYGWGYFRPAGGQPGAACIKAWHASDESIKDGSDMTVEGNTFALSRYDIICTSVSIEKDVSKYKNNIMIQTEGNRGVTINVGSADIPVSDRPIWNEETLNNNKYLRNRGNKFYTVH